MKNLIKRTLTGTIFSVTLLSAFILSPYSMIAMVVAIGALCLFEYYKIAKRLEIIPMVLPGIIVSITLLLFAFLTTSKIIPVESLFAFIPVIFFIFIISLYSTNKRPFENIAMTFFPIIHVIIPLMLLIALGFISGVYDYRPLVGILLLIWSNDVFAYLVGITLGKHPLFPKYSPKKSWEGFFGGLIFCGITSFLIALNWTIYSKLEWGILAIIVTVCGTFGDLFESLVKREVSLKDSGTILPGHGGVLDRFDSLLMVVPFAYTFIYFITL